LLVFGDGESGKTNLLRTFLRGLMARHSPDQAQILDLDYRRTLLGVVPTDYLLGYAGAEPAALQHVAEAVQALGRRLPRADLSVEQLRSRSWWQGPDAYVVVDDYDLVVTPTGDPLAQLLPLLPQARDIGLHLLISHRAGGAGRALYQPLLLRLKELGSPGLLLSGDPLEGFSDCAFGFAITLLVVSLDVPSRFSALLDLLRSFPSFAVSFAIIAGIWYAQYRFFRRYGVEDTVTVVLTLTLLFVVLFY